MKRVLYLLFVFVLLTSLAACNDKMAQGDDDDTEENTLTDSNLHIQENEQFDMSDNYKEETIRFPANDIRKTQYNSHIYEIDTFTLTFSIPKDWILKSPQEEDNILLASILWSPVNIYKNDEVIGTVTYNTFEKYPDGNYVAIYNELMLGNVIYWDREEYTPVIESPTACTATCKVVFKIQEPGKSMAEIEEQYNKGILSYDENLLVYVAIELIDDCVTDEEWLNITKSIKLSK